GVLSGMVGWWGTLQPPLSGRHDRWVRLAIALSVLLVAVCLGLFRASFTEHRVTPEQIDFYNEQKIGFEGVIVETDIRRDKAKYTIAVNALSRNGQFPMTNDQLNPKSEIRNLKSEGDVLINLDKYPQYHYGDRVKVYGELKAPGVFEGFDYGAYLSRYGVYSVMYRPWVEVLETGQGSFFWRGMSHLQNLFMERINKIFPEPHASFEAGLLVGARKGIPEDLMEKFNITGLTHIIAISGYNITIIIVFVMAALKGLPRRIAFVAAVTAIILFTLFVGASPAVVRASIMGILGLLALNSGRQSNIHLTVLWSACFMVLWNPKILWWDVGFQLSFAAVLGLIYVAPLFDKYAQKLPETMGVREAIQMTLSAQVMALPIIIFNFERLSLIAPLANLFVIFAIPPAMLFGFLAVISSFFFHGVSMILGYITWGILNYIIKIIEIASVVPYASVDLPGMKLWMMFGYYILLILFLVWYQKKGRG
ncbi:ComEC family competence protein, partial [Candidatus Peregrinibacteria bacterium]|nr:ComEC family competence protein [Candidatus Peregrinibacteria bacterium]